MFIVGARWNCENYNAMCSSSIIVSKTDFFVAGLLSRYARTAEGR